ncbi:MAG: glycerophosphodiester phosphodiesterase [Bifidobacteriaceae bacterium]|nr:glycerophosphodiester phosphodiesterase [Bifidobacteriaceae bacterium]
MAVNSEKTQAAVSEGSKVDPALDGTPEELAAQGGASASDNHDAAAFGKELDLHHAWVLPFSGYVNAAGYGYCKEPTFAVAQDGWDAYAAFAQLRPGAQLGVVYEGLLGGHDVDREALRYFLKFERGIIINGNRAY